MGGGGSRQLQTHTHTHSVPRVSQDAWSLGQGSNAMLTSVSVAHPLIKILGYEHLEEAAGGGGSRQWQTHTNTQTHTDTVSP